MVSQRIEIPTLDNPGHSFVKDSKTELRGAPATTIEWMILAYVAGKSFISVDANNLSGLSQRQQLYFSGCRIHQFDSWVCHTFSLIISSLRERLRTHKVFTKDKIVVVLFP